MDSDRYIALGGDVFLGGDLAHSEVDDIIRSEAFRQASQRVVNLEQPLSDFGQPADKSVLYTDSSAVAILKNLNITAVGLANNHIHDMGESGIAETINCLRENNIEHFGAGLSSEAAEPYWISHNLCIIAYCHYKVPTLNQVQLATPFKSGMHPLNLEQIAEDLQKLPQGAQAILMFHWGEEHLWLPTFEQIQMAKRLLEDSRVALILGMHAHRVQGYVEHRGKRAYMNIGNFLFPNFYIEPPAKVSHKPQKAQAITYRYHGVYELTYKKWPAINRISLLLEYDAVQKTVRHIPMYQRDAQPITDELKGFRRTCVLLWIWTLSQVYKLPRVPYLFLVVPHTHFTRRSWRLNILWFQIRANGVQWFLGKLLSKLKKRL